MSSTPIRTTIVAAAALTCMLGLTACHGQSNGSSGGGGSSSGGSTSSGTSSTPATSGGGSSSAGGSSTGGNTAAGTTTVTVKNFAFNPSTLNVKTGTKVTWKFFDSAPHNVDVQSGPKKFQSPDKTNGGSFSYTFNTAGTYDYICSIHPFMKASVVVK